MITCINGLVEHSLIHLYLHCAELEPSLISERVMAGMKAATIRGKRLGRPKTPERLRKK
ncbi:recombinase family protein [Shewanella surugensis]|uniref:Recombinase family protein n=1 Tax=Shewanella surugensis TaxID=212020 RepID=A0ABT0LJG2_9GAMM|nr:recombinase family protein [Shewanella surugensis]MCL1127844.1 recombinase family protein [Shewanella surugensis]